MNVTSRKKSIAYAFLSTLPLFLRCILVLIISILRLKNQLWALDLILVIISIPLYLRLNKEVTNKKTFFFTSFIATTTIIMISIFVIHISGKHFNHTFISQFYIGHVCAIYILIADCINILIEVCKLRKLFKIRENKHPSMVSIIVDTIRSAIIGVGYTAIVCLCVFLILMFSDFLIGFVICGALIIFVPNYLYIILRKIIFKWRVFVFQLSIIITSFYVLYTINIIEKHKIIKYSLDEALLIISLIIYVIIPIASFIIIDWILLLVKYKNEEDTLQ